MRYEHVLPTVTGLLRAHLTDGLKAKGRSNVAVSTVPLLHPTDREVGPGQRLNLCLFDVFVPSGRSKEHRGPIDDRDAVAEPTSLDLLFVLSSHGGSELASEVVLGHGMDLLSELRHLERGEVLGAINRAGQASASVRALEFLDMVSVALATEIEEILVQPEPGRLQDLDQLWSELHGPVAPSVPYRVIVYLSNASTSTLARRSTLGQERRFQAQPMIERVRSRGAPNLPIIEDPFVVTGQQLVLDGRFEGAEDVRVWLGLVEIRPPPEDVTNTRISFTVPPNVRAGVHNVVVACSHTQRTPGARPRIATSNVATCVLQPLLDPWSVVTEDRYIRLAVKPRIRGDQHVSLILNEWEPSVPRIRRPETYTLQIPAHTSVTDVHDSERSEISVPIPDVAPGKYLVRLQVDGAKSSLSIVAGEFAFPRITVP